MSEEEPPRGRLDPDAAARTRKKAVPKPGAPKSAGATPPGSTPEAESTGPGAKEKKRRLTSERLPQPVVVDTRRYQWIIGGIGITIVVVFSILLAAHGGNGTPGVAPGETMHRFVAPLGTSSYANIPANAKPKCNPAKPQSQGLNVCDRQATVLAFFVPNSKDCIKQVDTMQTVSKQFPGVLFAAVAVGAQRKNIAPLIQSHHWTIPVAYDTTDVVGQVYGVEVCPILELARAGGKVQQRLIGKAWNTPATLTRAVQKLVG